MERICASPGSNPLEESELTPLKCSCEDGNAVLAPLTLKKMKSCKPKVCTCPPLEEGQDPREVEIDLENIKEKVKFLKRRMKRVNKLCPENQAPISCQCSAKSDTESIQPPFDSPLTLLDCLPENCTCEDGSIVNTKTNRINPLNKFAKLCGKCPNMSKFSNFVTLFIKRIE